MCPRIAEYFEYFEYCPKSKNKEYFSVGPAVGCNSSLVLFGELEWGGMEERHAMPWITTGYAVASLPHACARACVHARHWPQGGPPWGAPPGPGAAPGDPGPGPVFSLRLSFIIGGSTSQKSNVSLAF